MKATLWMLMALIASMLVLAACPREGQGGEAQPESAINTPVTEKQAGEMEAAEEEAPVEATEEMTEEEVPGEEAVAEEEATEEEGVTATEEEAAPEGEEEAMAEETGADTTMVVFETTKGDIVFEVHPEWSPLGAEHFIELVKAGFYDGAPWFRVMEGFVAQCGIAADPKVNAQWMRKTIMDEPVIQGNKRSYVAFGTSGPNSRSTHIFINLADNDVTIPGQKLSLDTQGFPCFAQVVEGMEFADSLHRCVGDQGSLASEGGVDRFKAQFPEADFILKAYVKE